MQTHMGMNTKTSQKIVYQIMHKDMRFRDVKQNCDRCKEAVDVACKEIMKIRMELFPRENKAENQ